MEEVELQEIAARCEAVVGCRFEPPLIEILRHESWLAATLSRYRRPERLRQVLAELLCGVRPKRSRKKREGPKKPPEVKKSPQPKGRKPKVVERVRVWATPRAANPARENAWHAKRRAQRVGAMPKWADEKAMEEFYKKALWRSWSTGVPHHVDHIVPLKSALVCGLHVPANLRVVTEHENTSKRNRFKPDECS